MTTAFRVSGEILEYIKTGGWTTVEETSGQVGIAHEKSMKILDFLSEFGFIEFDPDNTRIRITDLGERFLELPEI
jgi:predicted transcriptional regulator